MSLPTLLIHSRCLGLVEATLHRVGFTGRAQVLRGGRALVYSSASRRNLGLAAARRSQLVETKSPPRWSAERGAWSSRPCGRKAWLVIGEVATPTERNGTYRRMSLPDKRSALSRHPCSLAYCFSASLASWMAFSNAFLVGSAGAESDCWAAFLASSIAFFVASGVLSGSGS